MQCFYCIEAQDYPSYCATSFAQLLYYAFLQTPMERPKKLKYKLKNTKLAQTCPQIPIVYNDWNWQINPIAKQY